MQTVKDDGIFCSMLALVSINLEVDAVCLRDNKEGVYPIWRGLPEGCYRAKILNGLRSGVIFSVRKLIVSIQDAFKIMSRFFCWDIHGNKSYTEYVI